MVDFKLDYMARLFRSIRNKRFESYAIQRIWHQLNDERIRFVTQQYFKRSAGNYALADLYLPQIGMVIEIDEEQHSKEEKIKLDKIREVEISDAAGNRVVEFVRIPIYSENNNSLTLKDFNNKIDELVRRISNTIERKEEDRSFEPWLGDDMLSPEYHKNKGHLSVSENEYVKTIDDAAAIFGTKVVHYGYYRPGGFNVPNKKKCIVWFPSVNSRNWSNSLINNGMTIIEYQKTNPSKRAQHVNDVVSKNETRITFFREKDALGFNFYKFVGVFQLNREESIKQNKCVWERIADSYNLRS